MYLGVMVLSISDSYGKKGFYNAQETGLSKALSRYVDRLVIYRFTGSSEGAFSEVPEGFENITVKRLPSGRIGANSLPSMKDIDPSMDALICFSDTQYAFPAVYHFCVKNNIALYPYIGVLKSHSTNPLKRLLTGLMIRRNINIYKKCLCLAKTPALLDELLKHGVKQVRLFPVGLDGELLCKDYKEKDRQELRTEYGYKKEERVVLFIGRLIEEKEPLDMTDIFQKLCDKDPSFRLLMIGDGPLREDVVRALKEKGLWDRTKLVNRIPNEFIWKLYRLSDIFVNLNRHEIFGMSILEALYYECPIAAINAPGPAYILKDSPDSLAKNSDEIVNLVLKKTDKKNPCKAPGISGKDNTWENRTELIKDLIRVQTGQKQKDTEA